MAGLDEDDDSLDSDSDMLLDGRNLKDNKDDVDVGDDDGDDDDDLHDIDPGLAIPMIQVTKTTLTTMMNWRWTRKLPRVWKTESPLNLSRLSTTTVTMISNVLGVSQENIQHIISKLCNMSFACFGYPNNHIYAYSFYDGSFVYS